MFRGSPGFKAQYHYLTLIVALEFDQWRILLHGPDIIIHGGRESDAAAAQQQALAIAGAYFTEEKPDTLPALREVAWTRLDARSCLTWTRSETVSTALAPL